MEAEKFYPDTTVIDTSYEDLVKELQADPRAEFTDSLLTPSDLAY